jgi:uncharacterized protein
MRGPRGGIFQSYMIISLLFFSGIIVISYRIWLPLLAIVPLLLLIHWKQEETRYATSMFMAFLVSFGLFQLADLWFDSIEMTKELRVLLNRGALLIIAGGLIMAHVLSRRKVELFLRKPNWSNPIDLPFHSMNTYYFWLIGIIVNIAIYTLFIVQKDIGFITQLLLFCILFSVINAVLEEVIWRGILLSGLLRHTSAFYAIAVTSIGFGLLHLAIGISFGLSLLFSLAGVVYGVITWKTGSIYPAILFHFVVNVGMVLSGFILG